MLLVGGPMIAWLKGLRGMKWSAREDTPDTHLAKAGTPSMGGIGIISVATLTFLALFVLALLRYKVAEFSPPPVLLYSILLVPAFTVLNWALGLVDDWSKASGTGGLRARDKFAGQVFLTVGFLLLMWSLGQEGLRALPTFNLEATGANDFAALANTSLLKFFLLFAFLFVLIVGTCNAVNLTDGIDGLAAGLSVQAGLVFAALGLFAADWWLCLAGACLGFLAFNKYPARVFMGDTGSLALGAALGAGAVFSRAAWLLPFVGFIFYVELLSVTAQVLWFKYTRKKYGEGRRLLRRAPLHHHFELGGWSEWRVVGTFWAINLITSLIGIILWQNGTLPRFP
jgi:phospho-N-acetylmuramoyl-pentapeptide-transferase